MTTLNIPSSPSQGATYEANGVVYTWDGTKWKADSSNVSNLNGGQLAGMRNQIINGDFRIWQRGSVITTGSWGSDRWAHGSTGTTVSEWRQRLNGNVPECPVAAEITSIGAVGDYIIQSVELPSAGNAGPFGIGSTWTLSFWANVDMISNWDQSHCLQFRDGTDAASNIVNAVSAGNAAPVVVQTSTSDPNWKKYAISGLTIDTAPAGSNLCLNVRLKLPTSAVRIGQTQLEPGPVATPFEHRPIGTELALCQRYYQTGKIWLQSAGTAAGGNATGDFMTYQTSMRAAATIFTNTSSGTISSTDSNQSLSGFIYFGNGNSGGLIDGSWTADAEL